MDTLRLNVATTPKDSGGGFHVEIFVNEVEMTSAGAGLGMDTYDLLVPTNRLVAAPEPHTVPVARCECGVYGCGSTDLVITSDRDLVHWDWLLEVPINRRVTFAANAYARELDRVATDRGWETPERTAGRLVLENVNQTALHGYGLTLSAACNMFDAPEIFRAWLNAGTTYQIFVDFQWRGRTPQQLADEVCRRLAEDPPSTWTATWHAIRRTDDPPAMAGRHWRRAQLHVLLTPSGSA